MTTKNTAAALLAATMALAGACDNEPLVVPPGGVSGVVCNPLTGRPATGATLTINWTEDGAALTETAETNDEGFFELSGIGAGEHVIELTSDAFNESYPVTITSGDVTLFLDEDACRDPVTQPGQGKIGGVICNRHTGELVKDATIIVTLPDGSQLTGQTNPETGEFEMDVPTGTFAVSVQSDDYRKVYVVEVVDGEVTIVEQSSQCDVPDPRSTGFIVGKVCAPGTTNEPLAGASVTARYVGSDGASYVESPVFTLDDGSFIIDPIGPTVATNVVVRAEHEGFAFSWNVERVFSRVDDPDGIDVTADVGCEPLVPDDGRRYLVVTGQFDRIEDVLERMELDNVDLEDGLPTDGRWAERLFSTRDTINEYDVVFVNCGVDETEFGLRLSPNAITNIRKYVEQGGSLYVSDWAYELVEQAFPDKINFMNDDLLLDDAQVAIGGAYRTTVVDPDLAEELETDAFDIDFSFQLGTVITEVAPDVTIYLEADMKFCVFEDGQCFENLLTTAPVTVGFDHGLGKVIYTSFHQEQDEDLDGTEDEVLRYLVFEL